MTQPAIMPWNLVLQDFIQIGDLDKLERSDMVNIVYIKIPVSAIENKQTPNKTQKTSVSREYLHIF